MVLYLGSSAYCRRAGWLDRMAEAFILNDGNGLFGSCGNMGVPVMGVYPHIRTTGFWCDPQLMNAYPYLVNNPSQRYPFEHGASCFTEWVRSGNKVIQL